MHKKSKVFISIMMMMLLFGYCSICYAGDSDTKVQNYLMNTVTGKSTEIDLTTIPSPKVDLTTEQNIEEASNVQPQGMYSETFIRYDQNNSYYEWELKETGRARVDNRQSSQPATLQYSKTTGGSKAASFSGDATVSANVRNAIIAKINATASIQVAFTRNWSSSTSVIDTMRVPAGKVGTIICYVPGVSSNGQAVYIVSNTSDDTTFYRYKACGSIAPAKNSWNFKHIESSY